MALCVPTGAIWPDPSVLPGTEPVDHSSEEHAAWVILTQQVEIATGLAWTTLQVLTAYQIAICPITIRPCRKPCAFGNYFIPGWQGAWTGSFWPYVIDGQWFNMTCGHWGECGCTHIQQIALQGPVGAIASVTIDGVDLPDDAYRVDNNNLLVRQDGEAWPLCQDMNLPLDEVGTWSITYYHGATADILVNYAAGILANEYLQAIQGAECRLPSGTVSVARQGVQFDVEKDMFENGLTGIGEVDAVTARYNPFRQKLPTAFFNPDAQKQRQTTWGS